MKTILYFTRNPMKAMAAWLASVFIGTASCQAGYLQTEFIDNSDDFRAVFDWTFPAAGADNAGPFVGGNKNWTVVSLNSNTTPNGPGVRNLVILAQHAPATQKPAAGVGPNPEKGVLVFPTILRPKPGQPFARTLTDATRIVHAFPDPNRAPHSDYFIGILKVPMIGNPTIKVFGKHVGVQNPFEASFENFSNEPLMGSFTPSYGKDAFGPDISFGTVQPGKSVKKTLPNKDAKAPSDFFVSVHGSVETQTTLAFLGETDDASGVSELELAALTEMLTGNDGFLTPMLRDSTLESNLFVFVNLLQWLGADGTFNPLQTYDITGGVNDLLPGYFISTTPITLGFDGTPQGTPFAGKVFAAGGIDGRALSVPEPSSLVLVGCAILTFAAWPSAGWRLTRKNSRVAAMRSHYLGD